MSERVYYDEFMKALTDAGAIGNGEGLTTSELVSTLGISTYQVQRLLRGLSASGQLEVSRKRVPTYDRVSFVPCYRIKGGKGGSEK